MSDLTVVVKVGGSLLDWAEFPPRLRSFLDGLGGARPVLVVGGGAAADFIRALDSTHGIGQERAHRLALCSLDLSARVAETLVTGLAVVNRPGELDAVVASGRVPVLAPRWFMENVDRLTARPLPECWDVTTDSIAARLAGHLGAAELVLLKSAGARGITTRGDAARAGLVDPFFPSASAGIRRVVVVNLRQTPVEREILL